MTKLKHSVKLPTGLVIPAGTTLRVSNEGYAKYAGQRVDIRCIPSFAIESVEAIPANAVNPDAHFKAFDDLVPGDMGIDAEGKPARILGKATGVDGYNALYEQFGNTSASSLDDLTDGMDEDEVASANFVAYSNQDGEVLIGLYGADNISVVDGEGANENKVTSVKPFEEVNASDTATTADGKTCTILAKGIGKTWFKQTADAFGLSASFDEIEDQLDEGDNGDSVELVLVKLEDGTMELHCYCPASGVSVNDETQSEASVEAIMAAAKRRWNKGGKAAYERMQKRYAGLEQISIIEDDEDVRTNIQTELDNAGIDYTVDNNVITVDDNDENAVQLSEIADTYPSVKAAMSEAGIECRTIVKRRK